MHALLFCIVGFCRDFLCWCVFYFGWLIMVDFWSARVGWFRVCFVLWWRRTVRIGFVAFGVLFVLALRDFDGDDVVVSWKTVIL